MTISKRFKISSLLTLTFIAGALISVSQQEGPWTIRVLKVILLANTAIAIIGIAFGLQAWRRFKES